MDATDQFLTGEQIDRLLNRPPHKIILTTDALLSKVLTSLNIDHQLVGRRFPYGLLADYYKKTVVLHLKDHIIDIRQIPLWQPTSSTPDRPLLNPIRKIDLTHPDSITQLENFLNGTKHRTLSDISKGKKNGSPPQE